MDMELIKNILQQFNSIDAKKKIVLGLMLEPTIQAEMTYDWLCAVLDPCSEQTYDCATALALLRQKKMPHILTQDNATDNNMCSLRIHCMAELARTGTIPTFSPGISDKPNV